MADSLAERVRRLRGVAELSQRELARLAAIADSYPSLIESGSRERIGGQVAVDIARVLGVSVEWLLTGAGEAPPDELVREAVERARGAAA